VIPSAFLQAWSTKAPWPDLRQVEQDLIICRARCDLFNAPALAGKLPFRGGTAIHKLLFKQPLRYSEDIDLVQTHPEPIGGTVDAIRAALSWLGKCSREQAGHSMHLVFEFTPEIDAQATLKLKVEINTREHASLLGVRRYPFAVENDLYRGTAEIASFEPEELFGAKLRALLQRRRNLIALPLQKKPRENGLTVFVDSDLRPHSDQWEFLASIQPMSLHDIEPTIVRATGGVHLLEVTFIDDEDLATPWKRAARPPLKVKGAMPKSLTATLANLVHFEKDELPQPLANRLIRLAAFQNPEFYRAQAMRLSVWDNPRVIGCAENYPRHFALPRGCLDVAQDLLREYAIRCDLRDERNAGEPNDPRFVGTLRIDQQAAAAAMLHYEVVVRCALTAFGKTVTAAAMIARRGVNTLVLVHRTELLKQWQERLQTFLGVGGGVVGTIGGCKA